MENLEFLKWAQKPFFAYRKQHAKSRAYFAFWCLFSYSSWWVQRPRGKIFCIHWEMLSIFSITRSHCLSIKNAYEINIYWITTLFKCYFWSNNPVPYQSARMDIGWKFPSSLLHSFPSEMPNGKFCAPLVPKLKWVPWENWNTFRCSGNW